VARGHVLRADKQPEVIISGLLLLLYPDLITVI